MSKIEFLSFLLNTGSIQSLPISVDGDSFSGYVWGFIPNSSVSLTISSSRKSNLQTMFRISPHLTIPGLSPGPDHPPLTWSSCFCLSYTLFIHEAWRSLRKALRGTRHCKPDNGSPLPSGKKPNPKLASKLSLCGLITCLTSPSHFPSWPITLAPLLCQFSRPTPYWGICMRCSLSLEQPPSDSCWANSLTSSSFFLQ